jgi:hypothetical protein
MSSDASLSSTLLPLVGVLVGAGITWIRDALTQRTMRSRNAHYFALRVVCLLDKYIEDCATVAEDDGSSPDQKDEEGSSHPRTDLPTAPAFSPDLDWKSIDQRIAYKLVSMENETTRANWMISGAEDNAFPLITPKLSRSGATNTHASDYQLWPLRRRCAPNTKSRRRNTATGCRRTASRQLRTKSRRIARSAPMRSAISCRRPRPSISPPPRVGVRVRKRAARSAVRFHGLDPDQMRPGGRRPREYAEREPDTQTTEVVAAGFETE